MKRRARVDERDRLGWTPLMADAGEGRIEQVRSRLAAGADPNAEGMLEWTPLFCAAFGGHVQVLRDLIASGADLRRSMKRASESFGGVWSAMTWAACGGHAGAMEFLREAGLEVGWNDAVRYYFAVLRGAGIAIKLESSGYTSQEVPNFGSSDPPDSYYRVQPDVYRVGAPLPADPERLRPIRSQLDAPSTERMSIGRNSTEMQGAFLVEFAQSPTPVDDRSRLDDAHVLRLSHAEEYSVPFRIERHLLGTAPIAAPVDSQLLRTMAEQDLGWAIELLLPPERRDSDRLHPALLAAAQRGDGPLVRLLLDRGADARRADDCVRSLPIHWAAAAASPGALIALIEAGSSVNARDASRRTPLHWAAEEGRAANIRALLDRGADPRLCTKERRRPFDRLPGYPGDNPGERVESIRLLLPFADEAQKTGALIKCVEGEYPAAVRLLIESGARVGQARTQSRIPLLLAVEDIESVRALLDGGADPNVKGVDGEALLHKAALEGSEELALLLLDRGADPNLRDKSGETPLMAAARGNATGVARRLLTRGAAVDLANKDGETSLFIAALQGASVDFVRLLLEAGADPNRADDGGRTPVHEAAVAGQAQAVELLIKRGGKVDQPDRSGKTPLMVAREQADKRASNAVATLEALQSGGGDPAPIDPAASLQSLFEHATALFDSKLYDRAEPYFQEILRRRPDHAEALNVVGVIRLRTDRFKEALALFEKSIRADPTDFRSYFNAGLAAEKLGKSEAALDFFNRARQAIDDLPYGLRGVDSVLAQIYEAQERLGVGKKKRPK